VRRLSYRLIKIHRKFTSAYLLCDKASLKLDEARSLGLCLSKSEEKRMKFLANCLKWTFDRRLNRRSHRREMWKGSGKIAVYINGADFRNFHTIYSPKRGEFRSAKISIGTQTVHEISQFKLTKLKKCRLPISDLNTDFPAFLCSNASMQPRI
jgi:hypothetical protein